MAWPLTPLTTYVANNTPAIKAADLNSIQSAVNSALLGTYSYQAIVIDGAGGAVVTPLTGTIKVSATVATSTAPTTAMTIGALYKDMIPIGWASVLSTGALKRGINVFSVGRVAQGTYQLELSQTLLSTQWLCPIATVTGTSGALSAGFAIAQVASFSMVNINVYGALTNTPLSDMNFDIIIFGG